MYCPGYVGWARGAVGYRSGHAQTGAIDCGLAFDEVQQCCFEAGELLRYENMVAESDQLVTVGLIKRQMSLGRPYVTSENYHRLRHVRPSRAIITAASVGPEEPAG